jgi:hypothetical protein
LQTNLPDGPTLNIMLEPIRRKSWAQTDRPPLPSPMIVRMSSYGAVVAERVERQ